MTSQTSGLIIFSSIYLMILFFFQASEVLTCNHYNCNFANKFHFKQAIHVECIKFTFKNNFKYGNLTIGFGNATHNGEITYVSNREVKNLNVNLKI